MKALLLPILALAACQATPSTTADPMEATTPRVQFLELVTPDVEAVIAAYSAANGLTFGEPVPELGGARTAPRPDGSMVSVRAPMHEAEYPVVRPYWLVDDIEASLAAAVEAGVEVAMAPTELPGRGTFAIYLLGGGQHGLWQL